MPWGMLCEVCLGVKVRMVTTCHNSLLSLFYGHFFTSHTEFAMPNMMLMPSSAVTEPMNS